MFAKEYIKKISKKIPFVKNTYIHIAEFRYKAKRWKAEVLPIYKARIKKHKAVFLVLTPQHSNLGDHAIAQAETTMMKRLNIDYIEVTGEKLFCLKECGWLKAMNGRKIVINGGGNLGTLWFDVEEIIRLIISENPKSTIVCMPSTIYYEKSEWGAKELSKSIDIYNKHPDLYLYAREQVSYMLMKKVYKNVKLMPDMVMSLNECKQVENRKGCLLCLRSDCEKTMTDQEQTIILEQVKKIFGNNFKYTDMCVGHSIPVHNRRTELDLKFDEFRNAQLVITDRLHGMIFCAITGTPCIVLNSKSPKVRGCYKWIEHLEYIRFMDDINNISSICQELLDKQYDYDSDNLVEYFKELEQDICCLLK